MVLVHRVATAPDKLLVFTCGLGSVATTFIAGVEAVRRGIGLPIGSITQMHSICSIEGGIGQGEPSIAESLGLCPLNSIEFAAWDIFSQNALQAAQHANVLCRDHMDKLSDFLSTIKPMQAAFLPEYVSKLAGNHTKPFQNRYELAEALRRDIRERMAEASTDQAVLILCGSTEIHLKQCACHRSPDAFLEGMKSDDPGISPSQLYAWAAIMEGVPIANATPNLMGEVAALCQLAHNRGVPIAGKDLKTGQTFIKTALAPAFQARSLGVSGWFSTNILGNRDGLALDDERSFKAKEATKTEVLNGILDPKTHPDLYSNITHKVRINYYPPRGDAKEGWDNIDLFGWLGYPMQMKINFLCRDSILAAPLILDLALLLPFAKRQGDRGIQPWLSFFFKSPHSLPEASPIHDLFAQKVMLAHQLKTYAANSARTVSQWT